MAAPTPTVRGTPSGIYIPDGYQSLVTFGLNTTLKVWEKTVKPGDIDGGEPIDTTTMFDVEWHPMRARKLKKRGPFTMVCAYDPDVVADLIAAVNREDTITCKYPDGTTDANFAFLQKAEFGELKEGEFPEVTLTAQPMNWDKSAHVEAGPAIAAVAGT